MPDSSTVDTFNHIRQSGQLEEMGKRIDKLSEDIKQALTATGKMLEGKSSKAVTENAISDMEKKLAPIQNIQNITLATKKTVEEVQRSSISKTSVIQVLESEKKLILEEVNRHNATKVILDMKQDVLDMQRTLQQSLQKEYKESITQLSRSFHAALNSSITTMASTFNANMIKMKEEIKAEITAEMRAEIAKEKTDIIKENQAAVQKCSKSIKECFIVNMSKQDHVLKTHITNVCTR